MKIQEREYFLLSLAYEHHGREVVFFDERLVREAVRTIATALSMPAKVRAGSVTVALEEGEAVVCLDRLDLCSWTRCGKVAEERTIVHMVRSARLDREIKEAQDAVGGGFGFAKE